MIDELYQNTILRIEPIAKQFKDKYGIEYPINNTLNQLSELNYYIIKTKAPSNLSGLYMKKGTIPFIFVNTMHSLGRQNFSMWHEVYHHICGHENGISEFGTMQLQEREAEIFAGCIMLPSNEIDKWSANYDFSEPGNLAHMSEYYQMSFNAVVVRIMQTGKLKQSTYKELKKLSRLENAKQLQQIYIDEGLDTSILKPTLDTRISRNIMKILQKNYDNHIISTEKINDIIKKIEVLSHERS